MRRMRCGKGRGCGINYHLAILFVVHRILEGCHCTDIAIVIAFASVCVQYYPNF